MYLEIVYTNIFKCMLKVMHIGKKILEFITEREPPRGC
jgi:hypothetical protein